MLEWLKQNVVFPRLVWVVTPLGQLLCAPQALAVGMLSLCHCSPNGLSSSAAGALGRLFLQAVLLPPSLRHDPAPEWRGQQGSTLIPSLPPFLRRCPTLQDEIASIWYLQRASLSPKEWLWMLRGKSKIELNNFSSILFYCIFHYFIFTLVSFVK